MTSQRHFRGGSVPRASRPNLTLDTHAPLAPNSIGGDGPGVLSAPVGTRQEQGMAPVHQAGDRHVAKLAEMMESPTWRSQNPGPHVRNEAPAMTYSQAHLGAPAVRYNQGQAQVPVSYIRNEAVGLGFSKVKEKHSRAPAATGQALQTYYNRQPAPASEDLRLGLSSIGHEVKILGIQPFPKTPETSNNTFIVSAAVSQQRFSQEALRLRPGEQNTENNHLENDDIAAFNSQAPTHSYGGAHFDRRHVQQDYTSTKALPGQEYRKNDVQNAMERGEAFHDKNCIQRPSTPKEGLSFEDLLNRLKPGRKQQAPVKKTCPPADPAILSYTIKEEPTTPGKDEVSRVRSDSGYTSMHSHFNSLSVSTRPSTHARSSLSAEVSGSADSYESPSKNSALNPTAKEFAIAESNNTTPFKQGGLGRPAVFGNSPLTMPPQQFQVMRAAFPQPQIGSVQSSQGPWYPPQVPGYNQPPQYPQAPQVPQDINNQAFMQHLESMRQEAIHQRAMLQAAMPGGGGMLQGPMAGPIQQGALPGPLATWVNYPGQAMPPMAGINPMTPPMGGVHHASGGLGTPPLCAPPIITSPFHQQLDGIVLGQCYNPGHQNLPSYAAPVPAAPLAGTTVPQNPGSLGSQTALTASAVPFIPRHVPKPKVPNTTGQQNWELMHELRRMNEPGYAQKCKEKQKKRFQKQLEKTGGQS